MPEATIEEIRDRNDIVEVISRYVTLAKAGARYKGLCPFHREKTPSFTVNREKQVWYCFGCHEGGDVFDFIKNIEKVTFPEAAEQLAARIGLTFARSARSEQDKTRRQLLLEANARAGQFFHSLLLKDPRGKVALDLCKARGLNETILEKFRLGFAPDSWDTLWTFLRKQQVSADIAAAAGLVRRRSGGEGHYDYFRNRLMVPIRDTQGQIIAFGGRTLGNDPAKYINSPEGDTFSKGQVLFGLDVAAKKISEMDVAIVVEGYMDQMALFQFGFENCVATMGTAITPDHLRKLSRYTRNLYLGFDADSAGMNAVLRSAALFDQHEMRVRILEIPEGFDPDDFVRKRGAAAFARALEDSPFLIDYRIRQATQGFASRHGTGAGDAEGLRAEMIRAVVPILAEVTSPIVLESLVHRLAQEWCAPDLHRVTAAEQAIQRETALARSRKGREAASHQPVRSALDKAERPQTETAALAAPSLTPVSRSASGLVRAEREILAAMLQGSIQPGWLDRLRPDRFLDPTDRRIATRLHETWSAGKSESTNWIQELVDGPETTSRDHDADSELQRVVYELLVLDVKYLDRENAVQDRVERILDHWRKLEEKQKRDAVVRKIDSGDPVQPADHAQIRDMTVTRTEDSR